MLFKKAVRFFVLVSAVAVLCLSTVARAEDRATLERTSQAALNSLIAQNASARDLSKRAVAVLVFPDVKKAGLIVGGQFGEGALMRGATTQAYYNIVGASLGLLAGAQSSGLAMFFMNETALAALMHADGWEIGTGPAVTFLDHGLQANVTSSTLREPVYAISFNQQGLMAALALNGTKITRITPP